VIYWDTSGIHISGRRQTRRNFGHHSAAHAEFYARTTGKGFMVGGRAVKLGPGLAAQRVRELQAQVKFVLLSEQETAQALSDEMRATNAIAMNRNAQ
jgi:hypothetical protein